MLSDGQSWKANQHVPGVKVRALSQQHSASCTYLNQSFYLSRNRFPPLFYVFCSRAWKATQLICHSPKLCSTGCGGRLPSLGLGAFSAKYRQCYISLVTVVRITWENAVFGTWYKLLKWLQLPLLFSIIKHNRDRVKRINIFLKF